MDDVTVAVEVLKALAKVALSVVQSGGGWLWAMFALLATTTVLKAIGSKIPKLGPLLATRWGGWALNLLVSFSGAALTAALAGASLTSSGLWLTALGVGFAAAGGYEALRDLLPERFRIWLELGWAIAKAFLDPKAAAKAAGEAEAAKVVPVTADQQIGGYLGSPTEADKAAFAAKMTADGYTENADGSWSRRR